jgi:1-acyl-sn-glycerol-3-phosphate acyltransferase
MLRTIWITLVALVATLINSPIVIASAFVHPNSPMTDRAIRRWARAIVNAAGVDLRVEHPERIDPDGKYIFVANHHSYLDIPCLLSAIPQQVRFMAKASLFNVPIFGWGLRAAGFIPIDRRDRSKALKSFDLAGDRIRKGNSIVIFPEAGRSSERDMKPFQRGAFLLAIRSQLPIVPVAIDGTWDVLPATRITTRPGIVTIRFAPPVDTGTLPVSAKDSLMESTRAQINSMLLTHRDPETGAPLSS